MKFRSAIVALGLVVAGALAAHAPAFAQEARQPEGASGYAPKPVVIAQSHMVVAAHPLAAQTGREILRAGGSAVDAAIAVQLVLGLVEPQSSGLGGGTLLVYWDEAAKKLSTYDGRETAPAAAKPDRFLRDGQPMKFDDAVLSGLSVGVPGTVKLLEHVHKKHGKLPWAKLFEPAISLAREGFPFGARLNALTLQEQPWRFSEGARRYFFGEKGFRHDLGETITNAEYAATLEKISSKGAAAFYEGESADAVVAAVAGADTIKGDLTLDDLKNYAVKEREPQCFNYRDKKICGMGPPSSGITTIGQTLKLVEPFEEVRGRNAMVGQLGMHLIVEAEKLAFADRGKYLGDPEFVNIPSGLLDEAYIASRRQLISRERAMEKPAPGLPPGLAKKSLGEDFTHEAAGTSHISIVDDQGNAVSMTTTIESAFGSHLWAAGFLLNNEMTDFSFVPADKDGNAVANRVEPGKRPRSSMSPVMVFDASGHLEMVSGSPGGSRIIWYMVKVLMAHIDWGQDAVQGAGLPNFGSEGGPFVIEPASLGEWGAGVALLGHKIVMEEMTSGVHTIVKREGHLEGGADPRREGVALGD